MCESMLFYEYKPTMTVFHEKRREYMSNRNIILDENDSLEKWDELFDKMVEEEFPQENEEEEVEIIEDEVVEDEEETVVEDENVEDISTPEIPEEEKQRNFQFASMRNENKQLMDEMADMARTLGFSGVNEMREQVAKFKTKTEMESRNIPEEQEAEYLALVEERKAVEAEKEKLQQYQLEQNRAHVYDAITRVVEELGITVDEADKAFTEQGLNAGDLIQNPHLAEVMLRGALQGYAKKADPVKEDIPKPTVESNPIKTTVTPGGKGKVDIEKLIEMDLKDLGYDV